MILVALICVGGILCLTPLALYLRWLAGLNRSKRPVVVPGTWDTIALLAGLSGFLVFGGGLMLLLAQSNTRLIFRGNLERFQSAVAAEWWAWVLLSTAYVLILIGGTGLLLLFRSRALSVYNIERSRAEAAIEAALRDLHEPLDRRGDAWTVRSGWIELQAFDGLQHATIWLMIDDLRRRQDVERHLRNQLAVSPSADGSAAAYLFSAATTVACMAFSFAVMIAYLFYAPTR